MADVTLHLGDCLDVLRTLADGSVDAVVTDPPYSSGGMVRGDRNVATSHKYQHGDTVARKPNFGGDTRDQRSWLAWCDLWLSECRRVVRPGGVVAVFSDWRQLPTLSDAIQTAGWIWRGIAVWDKGNAIPQPNAYRQQCEFIAWGTSGPREADYQNGAYPPGCFRHKAPRERVHVTEKPVALMADLLAICRPGGTVLDPFAGSGTTLVAAAQLGLSAIGIEKSPAYHAIARRRIDAALAEREASRA